VQERTPHILYPALELRERSVVLDDEVGAGSFELGRHLRGDHVHRFRLLQSTVLDEPIETNGAVRVDENDAVEAIGHVTLEQKRDVADDDPVAALPRLLDQAHSEALDLGMDDLVKFLELRVVGENDSAERGTVEVAIGSENFIAPSGDDPRVTGGAELNGAPSQNVGVDDRRAALGQQLRDGRFATANISRESYQEHDGFLG
jgi:hypothetical protein